MPVFDHQLGGQNLTLHSTCSPHAHTVRLPVFPHSLPCPSKLLSCLQHSSCPAGDGGWNKYLWSRLTDTIRLDLLLCFLVRRKECKLYAGSAACVTLISGWKHEPQKQQVQNEVNNFVLRQTACDTTEHLASADVIAYVLVTPCLAPKDQRPQPAYSVFFSVFSPSEVRVSSSLPGSCFVQGTY